MEFLDFRDIFRGAEHTTTIIQIILLKTSEFLELFIKKSITLHHIEKIIGEACHRALLSKCMATIC